MIAECRKCGVLREIKLDKKSGVPFCLDCGQEQDHISTYAIASMKSMSDYAVKSDDSRLAFGVDCPTCAKKVTPVYNRKDDKAICTGCGKDLELSVYMLRALDAASHREPSGTRDKAEE